MAESNEHNSDDDVLYSTKVPLVFEHAKTAFDKAPKMPAGEALYRDVLVSSWLSSPFPRSSLLRSLICCAQTQLKPTCSDTEASQLISRMRDFVASMNDRAYATQVFFMLVTLVERLS
jgi:hypothetical protein